MARVSKRTSLKLPQFVQKIISKTTEVKNLIAAIQSLNTQKQQQDNSYPSSNNILLFLPFDNSFNDFSSNNINIVPSNGGIINSSINKYGGGSFSAVNGGVCRSSGASEYGIPDLSNSDWTIECWVYRPTNYTANRQGIINLARSGTYTGFNLYYFASDGGIIVNDGLSADIGTGTIPVATWTHIAVVMKNGVKTLYVNGVSAATGTQNILTGPYKVNIGNLSENWGGDSFGSDIIIDHVLIYQEAIYTSNFTPFINPLVQAEAQQTQAQLTQKQNTLVKKVVKTETKVNVVAKTVVETKVSQSLPAIGSNESGYDVIHPSMITSREISFNSSPYYRMNISNGFGDGYIFTFGNGVNQAYFSGRFVIFKGQDAIFYSEVSFSFANTSDSRGYYTGTKFRTNWNKYKKSNTWCLYDALNDIMYYSNYSGSYLPTKKWYRADILYKTEIELKTRNVTSSGSSAGSGGSADSTGNSIGTNLVDQFLSGSEGSSGGQSIGTDLVEDALFNTFANSLIFGPDNL